MTDPDKMWFGGLEVGGGQPGIQAQRPAHRTHDTTDQWREFWWLGRPWPIFLLTAHVAKLRPELLPSFWHLVVRFSDEL